MGEIIQGYVEWPNISEVFEANAKPSLSAEGKLVQADCAEKGAIYLEGQWSVSESNLKPVTLSATPLIPTAPFLLISDEIQNKPSFAATYEETTQVTQVLCDNGSSNCDITKKQVLCDSGRSNCDITKEIDFGLRSPQSAYIGTEYNESGRNRNEKCNCIFKEAVKSSILRVQCKGIVAELHKGRFGSGKKGKCIKYNSVWWTPTGFEAICRHSKKSRWKQSIKFRSTNLEALIERGVLIPHSRYCRCVICRDDKTVDDPHTPPKKICYNMNSSISETNEFTFDLTKPVEDIQNNNKQDWNSIDYLNNNLYGEDLNQNIVLKQLEKLKNTAKPTELPTTALIPTEPFPVTTSNPGLEDIHSVLPMMPEVSKVDPPHLILQWVEKGATVLDERLDECFDESIGTLKSISLPVNTVQIPLLNTSNSTTSTSCFNQDCSVPLINEIEWSKPKHSCFPDFTWSEIANLSILPVYCRNIQGELYKYRMGSGHKGKCIKYCNDWYTPKMFEEMSGSRHDWKRAIRCGFYKIREIIEAGILTPHAAKCKCSNCSDDPTVTNPVIFHTPLERVRCLSKSGPETE